MSLDITILGGPGSGNFGHAGRPGQVGGSASRGVDPFGATDGEKWQASRVPPRTPEEREQQRLADAQKNPLAHPQFVLGMDNDVGGEIMRYVAAYGKEFKTQPRPADVEQGEMKQCYKNASLLVLQREDLTYAEGFAKTKKTGDLTFMHAWAVDREGRVVDPTWADGTSYFGVKYDRQAYLKHLYKSKFYGVTSAKFEVAQKAIATGGRGLR